MNVPVIDSNLRTVDRDRSSFCNAAVHPPAVHGHRPVIDGHQRTDQLRLHRCKAGAVSIGTPDGDSVQIWGYEDLGNNEGVGHARSTPAQR